MELFERKSIIGFLLLWTVAASHWEAVLCEESEHNFMTSVKPSSGNSSSSGHTLLTRVPRNLGKVAKNSDEADISTRIRAVPSERLNRYKLQAARQLQVILIRCFRVISVATQKVPPGVRAAAKRAITATQTGKLLSPIKNNIGEILRKGCQQQGNPAAQLQIILATLVPNSPPPIQGTLQNLVGFVSSNLATVNTLVGKLLGGVPDLLDGVIKSLINSLAAVTGALDGTLASIGMLLGGVLG